MTTMTEKAVPVDSDFLHVKKCARRSDRISELPDEIISHIVSFLPLKEAVATSILSPRWSNSWKYTPNLAFVNDPYDDPMINIPIVMPPIEGRVEWRCLERSLKNAEWVNSVLNSYKALSLKHFTISFCMHPNTFHQVGGWLHFAFSRRVEGLKLDFKWAFFLDINSLSGIQSSDYRFLRELTLESLCMSGEAIELLLRSCSVLERLIMNVTLTSDVVIGGSLKYLEIDTFYSREFIKVSAPNLTRLLISDYLYLKKLLLENVPNLVEASFRLYRDDTMFHFINAAAKLEVLTICLCQPKAFAVPQMPKLKKLVVDYATVNKKYLVPITCLLDASPFLEVFKLQFDEDYRGVYSIRHPTFKVPELGGFPHKHLKVFEFVAFCDKATDHVELVRYIGNNCVGLEEIVITPISTSVARLFELWNRDILAEEVDVIGEEREALEMKKSTEEVLAGKLPDRIKLLIN